MKIAELFDVCGLATVVTGGASGIGLACAEVLAVNGARVCILDRDRDALDRAGAKLRGLSADVMADYADVADRGSIGDAIDRATMQWGGLDVVFVNAGISGGPGFLTLTGKRSQDGAIEAIPEDHWRKVVEADLSSVLFTVQSAVRHMKARERGSIIVTTSIAGAKTENFVGSAYIAAKAGAAHLVRQVALELAKYGIRVNAMAPGSFVTDIAGGRMRDPEVQKTFARANPLGRMASTDEIKGLALFLASPSSRYVTGAELLVDGGACAGTAE